MKRNPLLDSILYLFFFTGIMQAQSFIYHSEDPFGIDLEPLDSFELTLKYQFYDSDNDGDQDLFMFGFILGNLLELNFDSIEYFIDYQENTGTINNPVFENKERAFLSFEFHRGPFLPSIGDLNDDGQMDILALSDIEIYTGMQNVSLYINNPNTSTDVFERIDGAQFGFNQLKPQSFLWPELVDLDMDGDLDLLASGNVSGDFDLGQLYPVTTYAKNVGTIKNPRFTSWFENPFNIKENTIEEMIKTGDLDKDGDPDILSIANQNNLTKLFYRENILSSTDRPLFSNPVESPFNLPVPVDAISFIDFELVDIDGDSDLDFFVFLVDENTEELSIHYYENDLCKTSEEFLELGICEGESIIINEQNYSQAGAYTILLTDESGCDSIINLDLTVYSIDPSVMLSDDILTAVDDQGSYQWFDCETGMDISGANSFVFQANESGLYSVRIIDENGCVIESDCYSVIISNSEEKDFSGELNIFPNPSDGRLYIENTSGLEILLIKILDQRGKQLQKTRNIYNVNIDMLSNGLYLFTFQFDKSDVHVIKKVIILKQE